jgi:hypothetical protein
MAKDLFAGLPSSTSTDALAHAIAASNKRMDELASLVSAQRVFKGPFVNTMQTVAQQLGTFARLTMENDVALINRAQSSNLAFRPVLSDLSATGFSDAAKEAARAFDSRLPFRSPFASSLASLQLAQGEQRALGLQLAQGLQGLNLAAAQAARRDFAHPIFSRSTDLFRAMAAGLAALPSPKPGTSPSIATVLQGVRQNQAEVGPIVEKLATVAVPGLQLGEAQEVALAFEMVMEAQAQHAAAVDGSAPWQADLIEQLSSEISSRITAQVVAEGRSTFGANFWSGLLANLLVALIIYVAQRPQNQQTSAEGRANTKEVTSRQDEEIQLLKYLGEYLKHATQPGLVTMDRAAPVYSRARKGVAVIAVIPGGTQAVVIEEHRKWRKVSYSDPVSGVGRAGWVEGKYLRKQP